MPITKNVNKKKKLTTFKINERLLFNEFQKVIIDF